MQPPGATAVHPGTVRGPAALTVPLVLLAGAGLWLGQASAAVVPAPTAAPVATVDQTYLDAARTRGVTGSDVAAISTARNACADLNAGGNTAHVAHYVAVRHGLTAADARIVLRAAVHAYCPAHEAGLTAS